MSDWVLRKQFYQSGQTYFLLRRLDAYGINEKYDRICGVPGSYSLSGFIWLMIPADSLKIGVLSLSYTVHLMKVWFQGHHIRKPPHDNNGT